ncbi:MAG: hypothetical protein AAB556_01370 [Patescibacteria group bacterium]
MTHEQCAEAILLEMRDKDGVFDFIVRKEVFDQIGIDWIAGRYVKVGEKQKELRIFIQHKSSKESAFFFAQRNPCSILWIVDCSTTPIKAKLSLLRLVIRELSRIKSNPNVQFFKEKLNELKNLSNYTPPE